MAVNLYLNVPCDITITNTMLAKYGTAGWGSDFTKLRNMGLTGEYHSSSFYKGDTHYRKHEFRITGTPTRTGSLTLSGIFVYTVYKSSHMKDTYKTYWTFTVKVSIRPINITTLSLPDGMAEQAYSKQLEAVGTAPITWSISSGSLPPGLSLDPATGLISGTPLRTQS